MAGGERGTWHGLGAMSWSGVKGLQLEGTSPALFYLFVAWVATSCIDTVITVAALKARAEWKSENQAPADANVFPDQYKIVFFFWKPRSHPQSLSYESADPAKASGLGSMDEHFFSRLFLHQIGFKLEFSTCTQICISFWFGMKETQTI